MPTPARWRSGSTPTVRRGWLPAQRVRGETALRAYIVNGAYAGFKERQKGQVKPGMLADIVVLSADLFRIPPADLPKTRVGKTRVGITPFNGRVISTRNQNHAID